MSKKSKLLSKKDYKGNIDGEVKLIKAGEEFLCDPMQAYALLRYYPALFEAVGYEESEEKKPKKKKKKKANLEYSNKMEDLYDEK